MDQTINQFMFNLAVIFLPGLIWAQMDARYAARVKPSLSEQFLRAFLFGLFTYLVVYAGYRVAGVDFTLPHQSGNGAALDIDTFGNQIMWAVPASIILGTLWTYSANRKWIVSFFQFIGATKKFGDEDVWDYTLNSSVAFVEYVHYRDFENQLVFAGWVDSFSESGKIRELVLRGVQVFTFDGADPIYETPYIYLAREANKMTIEFPHQQEEKNGRPGQAKTSTLTCAEAYRGLSG